MKRYTYNARDEKELSIVLWDDVEAPVAVVQIIHGMCEHMERYNDFATTLNKAGFIVLGVDQRGHGYTDKDKLGLVEDENVFEASVSDALEISAYAKVKYRLPVIVFGQGYGSFVLQRYLSYTCAQIHGAILSGSALIEGVGLKFNYWFTESAIKPKNRNKIGSYLEKARAGFDKAFKGEGKNAWYTSDKEELAKYNADDLCSISYAQAFYHYLFKGFKAISFSRHLKLRKDLQVLVMNGSEDKIGDSNKLVAKYKGYGLNPRVITYKDARHDLKSEICKNKMYEDVINFVNSCLPQ